MYLVIKRIVSLVYNYSTILCFLIIFLVIKKSRYSDMMPRYPSDPESKAMEHGYVTIRMPKLVRWLQVQMVSFSFLSLMEQPSDDQPPLPPVGIKSSICPISKAITQWLTSFPTHSLKTLKGFKLEPTISAQVPEDTFHS